MPAPADQPIILVALAAFFTTLALGLSVGRVWLNTSRLGLSMARAGDGGHRLFQLGLALSVLAMDIWAVLLPILGSQAMGVWPARRQVLVLAAALVIGGIVPAFLAQLLSLQGQELGVDDRPAMIRSDGVYRVVRNPIYAGVISMTAGMALATPAPWTVAIALALVALLAAA